MPARRKPQPRPAQKLSDLILSSDSEASEDAIVVRDGPKAQNRRTSYISRMPPRRPRGRPASATPRKTSLRGKKNAEPEPEDPDNTETDEIEDEVEEQVPASRRRGASSSRPPPPPSKPAMKKMQQRNTRGRKDPVLEEEAIGPDAEVDDDETEEEIVQEPIRNARAYSARALKVQPPKRMTKKDQDALALAEKEIAETQYTPMEVDEDATESEHEAERDDVASAQPPPKPTSRKRAASVTQQPAAKKLTPVISENVKGNNAGSLTGDTLLRKQYEEMKRRYEEMGKRLDSLTKLRLTDAEAALIEYKKVMEARIATSEKLNNALQEALNASTKIATENKALKKQLAAKGAEIDDFTKEVSALQKEIYTSQNDIQSLTAKLAVARQAATSSAPPVPGSAIKSHPNARELPHVNGHHSTTSTSLPWEAVAKEELYGDLTALTVLGVKVFPDQPNLRVYDCIQTGKNGTLHFKLTTPVMMVDDEDEITFTPHLDPQRDAKILSLLPEYLTEEITFARGNATRFYLKLLGVVLRNETAGRQPELEQ